MRAMCHRHARPHRHLRDHVEQRENASGEQEVRVVVYAAWFDDAIDASGSRIATLRSDWYANATVAASAVAAFANQRRFARNSPLLFEKLLWRRQCRRCTLPRNMPPVLVLTFDAPVPVATKGRSPAALWSGAAPVERS